MLVRPLFHQDFQFINQAIEELQHLMLRKDLVHVSLTGVVSLTTAGERTWTWRVSATIIRPDDSLDSGLVIIS